MTKPDRDGSEPVRLRVAAANVPRRTRNPRKRGLLKPWKQARALVRLLDDNAVDVCTIAEAHTPLLAALRAQGWGVYMGYANNRFPRLDIGNAIIHRKRPRSRKIRRTKAGSIRVRYSRSRRDLGMAEARYELTGRPDAGIEVCAVHLPTKRATSEVERDRQLSRVEAEVRSTRGPHALSGDVNQSGRAAGAELGDEWDHVGGVEVMHLFARGARVTGRRRGVIRHGYHGKVSDHPALPWADVIIRPR